MDDTRTDEKIIEEFYKLKSRTDVANILQIEDKSLRYFLYAIKPDNMYTEFSILKRNGNKRKISAPDEKLKSIQRKLADILNCVYKVKPAAYGFVKDKSILQNANNHSKSKYVLNIDLKDFFTQIHFGRVRGMFMNEPYNLGAEASMVIAQIACYNGALPQGAPSSPIITNMICSPLDTQLIRLAKKNQAVYTRYADDLTFSSYKNPFPEALAYIDLGGIHIGKELALILKKNSFEVNMEKVKLMDNRRRQEVTGLIVNRVTNVKREYIKEIRAILYGCTKNGIYESTKRYIEKGKCKNQKIIEYIRNEDKDDKQEEVIAWFEQVLKGKIGYIRIIRGSENPMFLKYAKQMNDIFGKSIFNVDKYDQLKNLITNNVFILSGRDQNKLRQGSGFLIKSIGIMTNEHVTEDEDFYNVKKHTGEDIGLIGKMLNEIKSSHKIDYACYKYKMKDEEGLDIGDSTHLRIGDKVTIVGYPEYIDGDSPNIKTCEITSITEIFNYPLYTINGKIVHGASGGVVLNNNNEVVGIIRGGVVSFEESNNNIKQGFVPIHCVLSDYYERKEA